MYHADNDKMSSGTATAVLFKNDWNGKAIDGVVDLNAGLLRLEILTAIPGQKVSQSMTASDPLL